MIRSGANSRLITECRQSLFLVRTLSDEQAKRSKANGGSEAKSQNPKVLLDQALAPFVPNSARDLAKVLADNVLYHSVGDVLVVDKPYGVGCLGYTQKEFGVFGTNQYKFKGRDDIFDRKKKDDSVTLEDAIPHLKSMFNEPDLQFCTGLKRWVSGPVVLPCSSKASHKIRHSLFQGESISHSREDIPAQHMYRALAICMSKPSEPKGTLFGHATFQNSGHATEYTFVPSVKVRKRARYGKFAVQGEVGYEVLASRHGLCLVDIHFSKFSRHFPRLLLSHLGIPIFGDWIYARRLLNVDGMPISATPKDAWRGDQYVPTEFLHKVGYQRLRDLRPTPPLFLSVYQSTLPFYGDTKAERRHRKFVSRTRPPEHFMAMAELINFTPVIEQLLRSLEYEDVEDEEGGGEKSDESEMAETTQEEANKNPKVSGDTKF